MENGNGTGVTNGKDDQFNNPLHLRKHGGDENASGKAVAADPAVTSSEPATDVEFAEQIRLGAIDMAEDTLSPMAVDSAKWAGKSLGMFATDNSLRTLCIKICDSCATEAVIMTCIMANVLCLIIQSPMAKLDDSTTELLEMIDLSIGIIFTLEMFMRIIAMGFVKGDGAYLQDNWYLLDFFVVTGFWFGVIAAADGGAGGSSAVRVIRALRPLKLINQFEELRNIMNAISMSGPYLYTIAALLIFFFVLFGTMGVALFGGALTRVCEMDSDAGFACNTGRKNFHHEYIFWNCSAMAEATCPSSLSCETPDTCREVPNNSVGPIDGTFRGDENGYIGFDNMLTACLTIFVVTTGDEWTAVSYAIQDSSVNVGFLAWPFCATIVVLLSLVTAELFTAVIAFAFEKAGEDDDEQTSAAEPSPLPVPDSGAQVDELGLAPDESTSGAQQTGFPFVPGLSPACLSCASSTAFEVFIFVVIVVNGFTMSLEHFDGKQLVVTPPVIEIVFVMIYTLELLIKILAWGIVEFVSGNDYGFNLIDLSVVISGIAGMVLDMRGSGILRVFRVIFRSLRVLRMARMFKKNRMLTAILHTVFGSFEALLNLMIFISFSLAIASILGMHLFGFQCHTTDHGEPLSVDEIPRVSYASFGRGILASFQVMTGEDWAMIMYYYMHCYGPSAAIFFCVLFVYTNWVLVAMFVAVILKNFELDEDEKLRLQKEKFLFTEQEEPVNQIALWWSKRSDPPKEFSQTALGCIAEDNGLRKNCVKLVESSAFEWFIIVVIVLSSAVLAMESPPQQVVTDLYESGDFDNGGSISINEWLGKTGDAASISRLLPAVSFADVDGDNSSSIEYMEFVAAVDGIELEEDKSDFRAALELIDTLVFAIFWLELILKCIAFGVLLPKRAYLADPWNRLDFFVVMGSTADIVLRTVFKVDGVGFIVLRTFRVLRPLRLIKHNPGMRVIVNTIIQCLPMVASVTILVMLMMFIFAVLGVAFFAGQFYSCASDESLNEVDCIAAYGPEEWANPGYNFDNALQAIKTLFICTTTEGWVDVMQSGMDAAGIGLAPVREQYMFQSALFFMIFMVVGNFFLCQLFVGVLVTYFSQSSGSALVTDAQLKWVQLNMLTLHVEPDTIPEPRQAWRVSVYRLVTDPIFEMSINTLIVVNVLMMCIEHFPQDDELTSALETAHTIFMLIFLVETLLKLTAFGPGGYFSNGWNSFDFCIVLLSVFSFFAKDFSAIQGARSLRVLRILLLLKSAPSLKTIFTTLVISIPPTLNIMALMGILMFVYGVLGIQLYGGLPMGSRIHHIDNFDSIHTAMMVLFQVATGQDFLGYMIELESYECRFLTFYFVSYYILAVHLLLNIFMGALLENFEMTFDSDALEIKQVDIENFKDTWEKSIPSGSSGRMPISRL
eukprot:SAG22_NODE_1195_length_5200_cov_2.280533_1_plen_1405_part_01